MCQSLITRLPKHKAKHVKEPWDPEDLPGNKAKHVKASWDPEESWDPEDLPRKSMVLLNFPSLETDKMIFENTVKIWDFCPM